MSFQYTLGDLLRFNLYTFTRLRSVQIVIAVLLFVFGYLSWTTVRALPASVLEKTIIGAVVLAVTWLSVVAFGAAVVLAGTLPVLIRATRVERSLMISDAGVIEEDRDCRHETAWRGVQRVVRTRRAVFLYFSAQCAYLVPMRVFRSADEAEEFYRYARAQAESAAA